MILDLMRNHENDDGWRTMRITIREKGDWYVEIYKMRGNISVVKRHIENYSYTFMATIDPIENKLLNDDRWEYGKMKDSCNIIERRGLSNNNEGDCYKAKKGIYYDGNLIRNVGWPK